MTQIRAMASERFGVIAPGARADLLLVSGDPLARLANLQMIDAVMISGQLRTKLELDAARQAQLPNLKLAHAAVDEYERLYVSGDINSLSRFMDSLPSRREWYFSEDVVSDDARSLAKAGKSQDAIELLSHVERLLPHSLAVRNTLGRIALTAGSLKVARAAFADSLAVAPRNAIAKNGLADVAAKGN